MVVIPFTRKRNIKGLNTTILFGKGIQLSSDVKYLGVNTKQGTDMEKAAR
jgi:hypothetical protein